MAMVFSHEVVKVGLVEIFIAIDRIENSSEANQSAHSHEREDEAVFGKETLLRNNGFVRIASLSDEFAIAVDVEV